MEKQKLNYIELIKMFWSCQKEYSLTCNDVAVYLYLLEICNSLGWKNPFQHSNGYLCGALGISEKTLQSTRNVLKQVGLLDFKSGNGRRNISEYYLFMSPDKRPQFSPDYSSTLGSMGNVFNNPVNEEKVAIKEDEKVALKVENITTFPEPFGDTFRQPSGDPFGSLSATFSLASDEISDTCEAVKQDKTKQEDFKKENEKKEERRKLKKELYEVCDESIAQIPDELRKINGFIDTWREWIEYRKIEKREPVTPLAGKKALNELCKLMEKGFNPVDVINYSIANQWQGLFPNKDGVKFQNIKRTNEPEMII